MLNKQPLFARFKDNEILTNRNLKQHKQLEIQLKYKRNTKNMIKSFEVKIPRKRSKYNSNATYYNYPLMVPI